MEPRQAVITPITSVMLWSTQGPLLHRVIEDMRPTGVKSHRVSKVIE